MNQAWALCLIVIGGAVLVGLIPAASRLEVIRWTWYSGLGVIAVVWVALAAAGAHTHVVPDSDDLTTFDPIVSRFSEQTHLGSTA